MQIPFIIALLIAAVAAAQTTQPSALPSSAPATSPTVSQLLGPIATAADQQIAAANAAAAQAQSELATTKLALAQLQAAYSAQAARVASSAGLTAPEGDLTAIVNAASGTIYLAGGGHYTINNAEVHNAGVRILGDPKNHATIACPLRTGITEYADGLEVGFVDYSGVATFAITKSSNPFFHDCKWTPPAWYGIALAGGTKGARILNCGGITHEYGVFVDAGVSDCLIDGCFGGSTDQHPFRCSGGSYITVRNCTYDTIGGKESLAVRKGDHIFVLHCAGNGPALWGEGLGDPNVMNVTSSVMSGCTFNWNKQGVGGQAEARVGVDLTVEDCTFNYFAAFNPPLQVGPGSRVYVHNNQVNGSDATVIKQPDGSYKLVKPFVWVDPRGQLVGVDDTKIGKLAA